MKKYLIGSLIVLAAGLVLFLLFNQGLFTASDGSIEPADDAVNVGDDTLEPVEEEDTGAEEEVVVDAPDEEASGEAGYIINDFPYQDFIEARSKGEPIVLKFYSET